MLEVPLFLLNEDVSHSFDEFVAFISTVLGHVATLIGIVWISSGTKPDSGITGRASVFIVAHDTNSCFRKLWHIAQYVEAFFVAFLL